MNSVKGRIKLRWIILSVIAILIAYLVANAISIWNYGNVDEKQQADIAIVLGAGTDGEEVSPVFSERLNHGIWLYEQGYVDKLLLTGGIGDGNVHSDAYVARQYVMERGVPETDILLEEKSTITQENIENAKEILERNACETAIIVSDPLHMKRAMLMAKDCGMNAFSSPTPTTRYVSLKSKILFLMREEFFYIGYKIYRIFAG